ncbi:MAG: hypothetical protein H0X21_01320 [Actinobacteria bacterium]|nr:hypothetical protein [Actinomycetota bacterium]
MKLLAAALAVAALVLPAAQAAPRPTVPGLVYTPGYGNSIVVRYDPMTLVRSGPRIRLGGNASSWSWSPGRRYLAIASAPQRLTVVDVQRMRVTARVRLAPGGGVTRAVTWARDRVLAVIETPSGAVVTAVDPLAGRVVRRTRLSGTFDFELGRLPDGLVFLLGTRDRIAPARIVVVGREGRTRVAIVPQLLIGLARRAGRLEQRRPGVAVDPLSRTAYLVGGDRIVTVDLDTLAVSDSGPLRTLAKVVAGSVRSARWLGDGLLAFVGTNWDSSNGWARTGLRIVDVRKRTARVVDRGASSFTVSGGRLLVESAPSRRVLGVTAYGFDGVERYRLELLGATWLKKQGSLGYVCRDAFLRSVLDLLTGRTLGSGFAAGTRCPTLLVDDSRG